MHPVPSRAKNTFRSTEKVFEKAEVPHIFGFDNLSAAVVQVEKEGEECLQKAFLVLNVIMDLKKLFCNLQGK